MRDGTPGILLCDIGELLLRLLVPEGVHQGHGALKRLLHGGSTGDGERNRAQLFGRFMMAVMFIIAESGGQASQGKQQKQNHQSFHASPHKWGECTGRERRGSTAWKSCLRPHGVLTRGNSTKLASPGA